MAGEDGLGLTEILELEDGSKASHVYEQKCAVCSQCCYVTGVIDLDSNYQWRKSLLNVIVEAFKIQWPRSEDDMHLCSQCTFLVGSLKTVQCQLKDLLSTYNDIKSKIAFCVMGSVYNNRVGDIYDSNLTATEEQVDGGSLQFLIYKRWREQYIREHQHEIEAEGNTGEQDLQEDQAGIPEADDKVQDELAVISNSTKQTEGTRKRKLIKRRRPARPFNRRVNVKGNKKGKKNAKEKKKCNQSKSIKSVMAEQPEKEDEPGDKFEDPKPGSSNAENNAELAIATTAPTPDAPEEITLAMSPALFQENGYARTDYKSEGESEQEDEEEEGGEENDEGESSDKSISIGQLSPGEQALIAGTFEIIGWSDKLNKKAKNESSDSGGETCGEDAQVTEDHKSPSDTSNNSRSSAGSLADRLRGLKNEHGLYVCVFCSKEFRHKYPFRDHVKTHTGDAPTCDICHKIFPKHHNLMLHMRTHTGEKPYKCEECGKGFADKSNLKVHMRAHTGERPYKCEFCHMGFVNSSRLVVHRRLHTGERPFQCSSCENSFCTKNQLQYHIKKTHMRAGSLYRCDQCPKQYMSAYSLKGHMKKSHAMSE